MIEKLLPFFDSLQSVVYMLTDKPFMLFLGCGVTCVAILMASNKVMRNNKALLGLLIVSLCMAIFQVLLSLHENTFKKPTLSDSFYSPLIYVVSYNSLRYAYVQAYGVEPTYNRSSWYDPEDGRSQNWLDVVVYAFPIFFSMGFPIILAVLKTQFSGNYK
ncbi:hypothetical protein KHS38_17860 [Mucilaginibacter sp. Bleaf8]|uniref:hypothetical protein n=1 Tax=Mucilaginibacter sp. Bleaf8 TaxID=2834430 RepID=UPI001BCFEDCA|nr:hypothetical protein [Mucilaginibacter sp. Bleaf8]MBS7566278.1 hypothetical protein [Mucilaginibacter sp. Bleaf8]